MAPRTFRLKTLKPEAVREAPTLLVRQFEFEVDPRTGERRVVAYTPNPATGQAGREDTPGWTPPQGAMRLPD